MVQDFHQILLWQRLRKTGSLSDIARIEALINDAAALLDRVVETFPTYTLHNRQHAINVAKLMGELLGENGVDKLNPLETAMLLLSAFWHDVGMVFRPDERKPIVNQPEWRTFLETHPEALLVVESSTEIPLDITENYCRWQHAERVFVHLNILPPERLHWGVVLIREDLGVLCKSHNLIVKELQNLESSYLGECDLKFCAVLLRIADILDFDSSRSPEMVYRFLDFQKQKISQQAQSDTEWRKHLSSNGFKFPLSRRPRYEISIAASPDDPAIEHDLRQFLDLIDAELQQCAALLPSCSERWRDFILPGSIDRRGIKSSGYHYGEYQFTLEQNQVLDLLMGDNLYQDRYVFVRELLQNAIDTCRHREYVEHAKGNRNFKVEPISISEWTDAEGYHWVRFDDFGMGMNEQIIREFLLSVDRCYYASPQFKADLLRAQKKGAPDFCPISRFGIGLLSCFLVGDRVEICTVRQQEHGMRDTPVRLSLNGIHGFYTLQMPPIAFTPMPNITQEENDGQRRDFGTSIAIRLDPRKEQGNFDLGAQLEKYLFCSPVPVKLNGVPIGTDVPMQLVKPFMKRTRVTLDSRQMRTLSNKFGHTFRDPIRIEFIPLDMTAHAPCIGIKGQLVLTRLLPSEEWKKLAAACQDLAIERSIVFNDGKLELRLEAKIPRDRDFLTCTDPAAIEIIEHIRQHGEDDGEGRLWISLYLPLAQYAKRFFPLFLQVTGEVPRWLTHNGITVPARLAHPPEDRWSSWEKKILWFYRSYPSRNPIWGMIYLSDSLRPNVSISRDTLNSLPNKVQSIIELAALRAMRAAGLYARSGLLNYSIRNESVFLEEIANDDLFIRVDGWRAEPIVPTYAECVSPTTDVEIKYMTLAELLAVTATGQSIVLRLPSPGSLMRGERSLLDCYAAALVQLEICIELRKPKFRWQSWPLVAIPGKPEPMVRAHKLFPPLTFVRLPANKSILICDGRLNSLHPFSKWLLNKAPEIQQRYPGIMSSMRDALLNQEGLPDSVNQQLDRLAQLHPEVRPPKSIYLKKKPVNQRD